MIGWEPGSKAGVWHIIALKYSLHKLSNRRTVPCDLGPYKLLK